MINVSIQSPHTHTHTHTGPLIGGLLSDKVGFFYALLIFALCLMAFIPVVCLFTDNRKNNTKPTPPVDVEKVEYPTTMA